MTLADILLMLIILSTSIGTLLFTLGYGVMFVSAFGRNKKVGVVLLVLLAFSVVGFVIIGLPGYYVLPVWLIPPIYAQLVYDKTKLFKRAMWWFWLGLILLLPMAWMLLDIFYFEMFFKGAQFQKA